MGKRNADLPLHPCTPCRYTWSADPKLADYYERALLNGILGNQNVSGGKTVALEYAEPTVRAAGDRDLLAVIVST